MIKKIFFATVVAGAMLVSCQHHDGLDISYNESGKHFSMQADFNSDKTRKLESYLDRSIGSANNISFVNMKTDAGVVLNDHTKFYMRKKPGHIEIKLNKEENSREGYHRVKDMCEGIKSVLLQ